MSRKVGGSVWAFGGTVWAFRNFDAPGMSRKVGGTVWARNFDAPGRSFVQDIASQNPLVRLELGESGNKQKQAMWTKALNGCF